LIPGEERKESRRKAGGWRKILSTKRSGRKTWFLLLPFGS